MLTYRFDVHVRVQVFLDGSAGTVMSFVSVGETANLTPGQTWWPAPAPAGR